LRNHAALSTRVLRIFMASIERELCRGAGSRAAGRGELLAAIRLGAQRTLALPLLRQR